MKVVLLQDDKKMGKKGDIVNVSEGFAFNNLIPQGKAKAATKSVIAEVKRAQEKEKAQAQAKQAQAKEDAKKLDKKKITIKAQAKGDKLFGSVIAKDIAQAIEEQHNIKISEELVLLEKPIKELTVKEVLVDYGHNVKAGVIVSVVAK